MSTVNLSQTAVWDTADKYLRNIVEEEDYGDYIIPMTVLRRLECILEPTKDVVRAKVNELKKHGRSDEMIAWEVGNIDGHDVPFYNASQHSLVSIADVDSDVYDTLMEYIAGFSPNIRDIWDAFEFGDRMKKLDDAGRLWPVIKHFAKIDMSQEALPDHQMGDLFEDVMYRSFNKKGKAAGNFYTPRDAIRLMVDILFASDDVGLTKAGASRTVYDPTAGTGGMLLVAERALKELNPDIEVNMAGQELMAMSYAIGKADLLIQGGDADAIQRGDTLLEDLYADDQFEYILSNPPFGIDWGLQQQSVREQAKEPGSRFSHGLPGKDDGQMLFLAHVASKLMPAGPNGSGGRGAVVSNGSPLTTGGPGTGPDKIRAWLLESDLVDAVIQLPTSMFYGTDITTYIWVLDSNKEDHRKGLIQLIDASGEWEQMHKGMGDKKRVMSEGNRARVLREYERFEETELSKIVTAQDLGFKDVKVTKQARLAVRIDDEVRQVVANLPGATQSHVDLLDGLRDSSFNDVPAQLKVLAARKGVKISAPLIDGIQLAVGVPNDDCDLSVNRRGVPVLDPSFSTVIRIPLNTDTEDYLEREVRPYAPGVVWDEKSVKSGYEILFRREFFSPTRARDLAEIDADVASAISVLTNQFLEVAE